MEIKIPDPGPVKNAIEHMPVKPPYFWVTGLVLSGLTLIFWSSSTGLGIAAAGAFLAAAWVESTIMAAFLNRPPGPAVPPDSAAVPEPPTPPSPTPSPAAETSTPPPRPETNLPQSPDHSFAHPELIDLEPAPPPKQDGPDENNPH